jgi:hypothetical protein
MQGTSMAAPHVTGVVALMKTIDPELSRREAADILISTGEQLTTDKPIGPLIDAAAAVEELKRRRENGVPRPNPDTPLIEPRPNPTNPTLPRDGVAIWRGRRAWRNPDVRRLIDLWLSISLPAIGNRNPRQGPFFWDRFGRVISIRVVYTILPPDYADIRYQWLWRNADRLSSRNFGTLSIFVIAAMRSGQFNPAPPANKPGDADVAGDPMAKQSEANGAHPVTTAFKGLATSFEWRQAAGANVATVTFNMNGSEGNVLKQFGLPAKVVVIAKKQGKAFVVPAANPMSVALTAAGANASKAAGGKPANIKATFTFTPAGKTVAMQSKISF